MHGIDISRFYIKVLGFQKLPRPDFPFGGAWLAAGGLFLHLIEADPTVPVKIKEWKVCGTTAISFPVRLWAYKIIGALWGHS